MDRKSKGADQLKRLNIIKHAKSLHNKARRNTKEFGIKRYALAEQVLTSSAPKWGGMKVSLISH